MRVSANPILARLVPKTAKFVFRYQFVVAGCVIWALLIFLTSCTVIRPQEFFDWIHEHLLIDDQLFLRFQVFWGISWFAVVKGWHALEFAILFRLCLAAANAWRPSLPQQQRIGWSIVVSALFAMSDEWHQSFVPDRGGTVTDVLIDWSGILLGAGWMLYRHRSGVRGIVSQNQ